MSSPQKLRIVLPTMPGFDTAAWDALTGSRMSLQDGMPWDADGEILEDCSTESELHEDFNGWLDEDWTVCSG